MSQTSGKFHIKHFVLACCLVTASLIPSGGAVAQMADEDMSEQMMAFMGGGLESPIVGDSSGVASLGVVSLSSPSSSYTTIDFPNASATRAFGINAVGDIVGSYTIGTTTHGYLLSQGNFTSIDFPGSRFTEAWGINPQGDIIGRYVNANDPRTHGFLLSGGTFSDISVGNHRHTLPTRITASGDIVGCFHDVNTLLDMRGYVQRGDKVTSFELLPSTMHNGVSPGGRVIAGIFFEPGRVHGYVLDGGLYTQFDFPGATFTQAWDVNPAGKVVGYFNPVMSHGFSLDADGFTQIDIPGANWTRIFGISPQGDMVGNYADNSNRVHGFILRGRNEL